MGDEMKIDIVCSATGERQPNPEWGIFFRVDKGDESEKVPIPLEQALILQERITDFIHHAVRSTGKAP
jgi:hypothetical protein